jgi:lysozyme
MRWVSGGLRNSRRTLSITIALLIAVVIASSAAWWFFWVPNVRPSLHAGEVYGIDVSNHQGEINWDAVASDDIDFAYIKSTEGGDFTDLRFETNWAEAARVGLDRGAYHFFTLCRPGKEQAAHFLRVAPPDEAALPPAIDLELAGNCAGRPDLRDAYRQLEDFLTMVEEAWDRPVLLYVGDDWEARYPVLNRSDRPRWLVSFFGRPARDWTVWQLHGFAKVDGIDGSVDLDVGRLDNLRVARK